MKGEETRNRREPDEVKRTCANGVGVSHRITQTRVRTGGSCTRGTPGVSRGRTSSMSYLDTTHFRRLCVPTVGGVETDGTVELEERRHVTLRISGLNSRTNWPNYSRSFHSSPRNRRSILVDVPNAPSHGSLLRPREQGFNDQ